jgi:hypothetical protein
MARSILESSQFQVVPKPALSSIEGFQWFDRLTMSGSIFRSSRVRRRMCFVQALWRFHLLANDTGSDAIAQSMQLIAGRTAQEYN